MNRSQRKRDPKQQTSQRGEQKRRPMERLGFRRRGRKYDGRLRRGIVYLPLVQQIPDHISDDENRNRHHKDLESVNQNRAPAKPLIASLIQNRRLQNEELGRDHHEADQSDDDLPNGRLTRRDVAVQRREQYRVEGGEDGQRAGTCEKRSRR